MIDAWTDRRARARLSAIILITVYAVGAISLLTPLREESLNLSALNLVLSAVLLLVNAEDFGARGWLGFGWCAVVGFGVEVLGVKTGLIFGSYAYTDRLGPLFVNVPLIIGLNWALLVHAIHALLGRFVPGRAARVGLGALGMTAFDWVMEPPAVALGYWRWNTSSIPPQNYLAWFVVSGLLFWFMELVVKKTNNRLAPVMLLAMVVFFLVGRWDRT